VLWDVPAAFHAPPPQHQSPAAGQRRPATVGSAAPLRVAYPADGITDVTFPDIAAGPAAFVVAAATAADGASLAVVCCATGAVRGRASLGPMDAPRLAAVPATPLVVVASAAVLAVVDTARLVVVRHMATQLSGPVACLATSAAFGLLAVATAETVTVWSLRGWAAAASADASPLTVLPRGATALAFAPAAVLVGDSTGAVAALQILPDSR
jgi:hypothetical protein